MLTFFFFLILEKFQYFRVNRYGFLKATRKVRNQFRYRYYRVIQVKPFWSSYRERTTNFPMRLKSWTRKSAERQGAITTVYSSRFYQFDPDYLRSITKVNIPRALIRPAKRWSWAKPIKVKHR